MGTNKLRIETGRWKKPVEKAHDRLCIQCGIGVVEDEKHFLLECSHFRELSEAMYTEIRLGNGGDLAAVTTDAQWEALMTVEKNPGPRRSP